MMATRFVTLATEYVTGGTSDKNVKAETVCTALRMDAPSSLSITCCNSIVESLRSRNVDPIRIPHPSIHNQYGVKRKRQI